MNKTGSCPWKWSSWFCSVHELIQMQIWTSKHTHRTRWAGTRKVKPIWILLKQETVSVNDISWAICKSAPRSRQITTPAPHHSVFYRPDALPAADQLRQSTELLKWGNNTDCCRVLILLCVAAGKTRSTTVIRVAYTYLAKVAVSLSTMISTAMLWRESRCELGAIRLSGTTRSTMVFMEASMW